MDIKLRDYQDEIVAELKAKFLEGLKCIVMCAPTGAGKTIMFCYMVSEHVRRGGKALILTDRIELLSQATGSFAKFGLNPDEIKAGYTPDLTRSCHVAMVETLSRRAKKYKSFIESRTLIIIDESHRTAFDKLFPYFSGETFVIGATATPHRQGKQSSMDDFYQDIVQPVDTPDLIERGFLAAADTYGVPVDLTGVKKKGGDYDGKELGDRFAQNKVWKGVLENYKRICPNTKTLIFTASIESSLELVGKFKDAGYDARHLDSYMTNHERKATLKWFDETPNGILSNVGILTTGFDQPDIKTVILYRATTSLPLFLQMVGRGSRICEGKTRFTLMDFGNNIKTHNLWEVERTWGIAKKKKRERLDAPAVKTCPKCDAMLALSVKICTYCDWEFKKTKEEKEKEEIVKLELLPKSERMARATQGTLEDKVRMAKNKLVHPFWVLHNMTDRDEAIKFCQMMGYKKGFIHLNEKKFKVFQKVVAE